MPENLQSTKIEMIRNGEVIESIVVEPNSSDSGHYELSSSMSVFDFPTLSLNSTDSKLNKFFLHFSKKDIIRISVSNGSSGNWRTLFSGEFRKKVTSFVKETGEYKIEVDAIHSFFHLSLFKLSSPLDFSGMTFRELVMKLAQMAGIESPINISKDLAEVTLDGISSQSNLYRLLKELCLFLGASVAFNTDNSVDIDFRSKRVDYLAKATPLTIHQDECFNYEMRDEI